MKTNLIFTDGESASLDAQTFFFIGRRSRLDDESVVALLPDGATSLYQTLLEHTEPGDSGSVGSAWLSDERRLLVGVLPETCSRYNSETRNFAITAMLRDSLPKCKISAVYIASDDVAHLDAQAAAVARAFPLFSRKSTYGESKPDPQVRIAFLLPNGDEVDVDPLEALCDGVRLASQWVDTPAVELDCEAMVEICRNIAVEHHAEITIFEDDALEAAGFGGIYGVGKGAESRPALVHLTYTPKGKKSENLKEIAFIGKGIVFDSGGLQVKTKEGMVTMKNDMAGSAAVLAAFVTAIRRDCNVRLHAILPFAENAIGSKALHPDDIITLYSGKSVEINNTDAEGRLILADAVAYAASLNPNAIVTLATLTGAQLFATGRKISAVIANDEGIEQKAVRAGRLSGDLVHPLPWCPEFYRAEFSSKVADMKNSVRDRMNAQTSAAGQFIAEHLGEYEGPFLHVDIAGPALDGERGTGVGVAFLNALLAELA